MAGNFFKARLNWYLLFILTGVCLYWYSARIASTPRDIAGFRTLEIQAKGVARNAIPAVVAIRQPGPVDSDETDNGVDAFASGVIISAEGLILSQHHVSHRHDWSGEGAWQNRDAGEMTTVVLADGRELQAKLLGADESRDLSLLKLSESGPHPFVPIAESTKLRLGDWVLQIGHPLGLQQERGSVVRLARVLRCENNLFALDSNTEGGDSGGPILDLSGHLVGIPAIVLFSKEFGGQDWHPKAISQPITILGATAMPVAQKQFIEMQEGRILPFDQSSLGYVANFNNFIKAGPALPESDWTQGEQTVAALGSIVDPIRESNVEIIDTTGNSVAKGIVFSQDGMIVTVANSLPDEPKCRLHNGITTAASIVKRDSLTGLALLSIAGADLLPISLPDTDVDLAPGSMIMVPTSSPQSNDSVALGIVSVPPRPRLGTSVEPSRRLFECDLPISAKQIGSPALTLDGEFVGLVVQQTKYGCKILTIQSLKYMAMNQSDLP